MSRDQSIDLLKGIGMIFVVAGHAGATTDVHSYIYSFHMPLFAFIGGLFLKTDTSFMAYARNKADRLLVPFYLWSIICWVIYGLIIYNTRQDMFSQHIKHIVYVVIGSGQNSIFNVANVPLWFLPFLFTSALIHYFINKIKSDSLQFYTVIFISLLGYLAAWADKPLPYSLDTAFTLYPFIWLGSKYLKLIRPKLTTLTNTQSVFMIITLIVFHFGAYLWEYKINNVVVDTASNKIGNYFLFYIGAFAAVGYWTVICNKIKYIIPINFIGRNAITILIFHFPIIQLLQVTFMPNLSFLKEYGMYGWVQTTICLLLCVPICYFINKFLKWSIGQYNIFSK